MTASQELISGRYRLVKSLGSGGMGRVWLARDEVLRRDVAMKEVLLPTGLTGSEREELKARTLREARAAARLSHPNVVQIYDVVRGQDPPWIVMEYVPAISLHQLIKERGPVSPQRAAQIGLAMLGALRAAHRNGVLHRDVKPSNVLIAEDGRVVLTDFGLATIEGAEGAVTRPGLVLGSPQYVAPERARDGVSSPESDLWSLGATLYAAVEGRSPYARSSAMATLTALATRPPDPSHRAGALKPVLNGLLRKSPRARLTADAVEPMLRKAAGVVGGTRPRLLPRPRAGSAAAPISPAVSPPELVPVVAGSPHTPTTGTSGGSPGVSSKGSVPSTGPTDEATPFIATPPAPLEPSPIRPRWRLLLVIGAVAVVLALVIALALGGLPGGREPGATDGTGPTGTTRTPSTVSGATATMFAAPDAVPAGEDALPAEWVWYSDPSGYRVGVPDGWAYSIEQGWVYFREVEGRRVLCFEIVPLTGDPIAASRQRADALRAAGELPGYQLVGLTPREQAQGGALWEYTYDGPDGGRVHEAELLLRSGSRGYRIAWRTTTFDWGASQTLFRIVTASFTPPARPQ